MGHKKSFQQIFLQKLNSTSSSLKSSSYIIGASLCCFSTALNAEASDLFPKTRYEKKLKKITRNKSIKELKSVQEKEKLQTPAFTQSDVQSLKGPIDPDPSSQVMIGIDDYIVNIPIQETTTLTGNISDDPSTLSHGRLVVEGGGTLVLSGANSYSGGTAIQEGVLSIAEDENLGNASGNLEISHSSALKTTNSFSIARDITLLAPTDPSDGTGQETVWTDSGVTTTLTGVISGPGVLNVFGNVVLTGANTYSGGTAIDGTLSISSDANLGSSRGEVGIMNSTLQITDNISSGREILLITPPPPTDPLDLSGPATIAVNRGVTATLTGPISDKVQYGSNAWTPLTKDGEGTLVLEGVNSYKGGTVVSNGVLIGNTYSIKGDMTNNATVVFDSTTRGTYEGNIDGFGHLQCQGDLALSGVNTYQGGTHIITGTLSVADDGNLGGPGASVDIGDATLEITGETSTITKDINVLGSHSTISVGPDKTATLSGVISDLDTSHGSLIKDGQGTLVLKKTNTYRGGTTINAGTLSISSDEQLGDASGGITFGLGGVLQTTGDLTSGRSMVSTGGAGIVVNGLNTFTGVLSGEGLFVKAGQGTLVLSGANTYEGGTAIGAGTLSVSTDENLGKSGTLVNIDAATLEITGEAFTSTRDISLLSPSSTISVDPNNIATLRGVLKDGDISSGALIKNGMGTLSLRGTSTYSGGTTINAGTLSGDTDNLRGTVNVGSNSTLEFDQNVTGTFNGSLSGDGTLSKKGSGILTLNQSSTIGHVVVESGKLSIGPTNNPNSNLLTADNNTLIVTHDVLVKNGATLGGSGKITGAINIESGGRLAPGNSIGPITVSQDLSLTSGSILEMEINPDTSHDNLSVQGTLTIDSNATLDIQPQGTVGDYKGAPPFKIIEASTINGQFDKVTASTMPSFRPKVTYVPLLGTTSMLGAAGVGSIEVTLGAEPLSSHGFGGNAGIIAQTSTLDVSVAPQDSDLYNALMPIWFISDVEEIRGALNQLHPSLFTGISLVQESSTLHASKTFAKRADSLARSTSCSKESSSTLSSVWADTSEHKISQASKGEEAGFKSHGFSQTIGVDRRVSENALVGAGFTYDHSKIVWKNSRGNGTTRSYSASLYSNWSKGSFFTNTVLTGGRSKNAATRRIKYGTGPVNVTDRSASHTNSTGVFSAHVDIGYGLISGGLTITPFGGLDYVRGKDHHFTETGAQSLDLSVSSANTHMLRSEAGFELEKSICTPNAKWTPYMALSFARESRAKSGANRTLTFVETGESATVQGLYPSRNIFKPVIGLSSSFLGSKIHTDLEYSGEFSKGSFNHNVRFEFGYKF